MLQAFPATNNYIKLGLIPNRIPINALHNYQNPKLFSLGLFVIIYDWPLSWIINMFDINPYYIFTIITIAAGGIPKGNLTSTASRNSCWLAKAMMRVDSVPPLAWLRSNMITAWRPLSGRIIPRDLPAAQPTSPLSAFLGQHCMSSAPFDPSN